MSTGKVNIKTGLPRLSRYKLKDPVGALVHDLDVPLGGSAWWTKNRTIDMVANGVSRGRGKNKWWLPGPLYHFVIFANGRVVQIVDLAWKSNNAGKGDGRRLDRLRNGENPLYQGIVSLPLQPQDTANGNPYLIGIGLARMGKLEAPQKMHDALVDTIERCFQHYGWDRSETWRVLGHKEWTHRKVDPRKFDMNALRSYLGARHTGRINAAPAPAAQDRKLAVLDRFLDGWNGAKRIRQAYLGDDGRLLTQDIQRLVGTKPDGLWGPNTRAAVVKWLEENT